MMRAAFYSLGSVLSLPGVQKLVRGIHRWVLVVGSDVQSFLTTFWRVRVDGSAIKSCPFSENSVSLKTNARQ